MIPVKVVFPEGIEFYGCKSEDGGYLVINGVLTDQQIEEFERGGVKIIPLKGGAADEC